MFSWHYLQGIGLDSCVMALPHRGLFLIQTTDFFYPLVDDPFIMVSIEYIFFLNQSKGNPVVVTP